MGALGFFWKQDKVDNWAKQHIYTACVFTVFLWGAKTWALTNTILQKINTFNHRCIYQILHIKMDRVKEERISNEKVRKNFGNIPSILELKGMQKLKCIGNIFREKNKQTYL